MAQNSWDDRHVESQLERAYADLNNCRLLQKNARAAARLILDKMLDEGYGD